MTISDKERIAFLRGALQGVLDAAAFDGRDSEERSVAAYGLERDDAFERGETFITYDQWIREGGNR